VLLYAYRPGASTVATAVAEWLRPRLVGVERVALAKPVLASVVRVATHPRVFATPSTPADAVAFTESLADAPATVRVRAGAEHWELFTGLVREHRLRGNDVPDALLAAQALELGATLVTCDRGFARFSGLRTVDPLAP
jgi:uncharacterized protein